MASAAAAAASRRKVEPCPADMAVKQELWQQERVQVGRVWWTEGVRKSVRCAVLLQATLSASLQPQSPGMHVHNPASQHTAWSHADCVFVCLPRLSSTAGGGAPPAAAAGSPAAPGSKAARSAPAATYTTAAASGQGTAAAQVPTACPCINTASTQQAAAAAAPEAAHQPGTGACCTRREAVQQGCSQGACVAWLATSCAGSLGSACAAPAVPQAAGA